jgi:tetratricopeptide (TPR) repeat protein
MGEEKGHSSRWRLIVVLIIFTLVVLIGAYFYYQNINQKGDPRTRLLKTEYQKYQILLKEEKYDVALQLLEKIKISYQKIPDYKNSYEIGVLLNDQAVIYLIQAEKTFLEPQNFGPDVLGERKKLLEQARYYTQESIEQYKKSETTQIETLRRLSVSYTNLGLINRYENKPKNAKLYYEKALRLWADNDTAQNNLNVLLGKPIKKRSVLKKMFPKDKK